MKGHETATDAIAVASGAGVGLWNFVVDGSLNTIIAGVVGILTIAVLIQRYRINRRTLNGDN